MLRRGVTQDRRGRDRDAGARAAAVEGDPARAREVLLPHLREHHTAARALARCCSHTCCSQSRRWPTGLAPAPATLMPLVVKADFGCQHAQKQPATRRRWAAITQVGDDSCADVWRHWHLRRRRPLARTTSRRDRQSMLSRVRVATSSARKPSLASIMRMAPP